MSLLSDFTDYLTSKDSSDELVRAQYAVMTRQTPLMYAILLINMAALALTLYGKAPFYLTVTIPAVFGLVCVVRAYKMATDSESRHTVAVLRRKLNLVVALAVLLGMSICAWSLALFGYGDMAGKAQVAFFIAVTIIAVITCLMPLRQIAMILFATVVAPASLVLVLQKEAEFKAIALNMLLVVAGMVFVLLRSNADFQQGIAKQSELNRQRKELQGLNSTVSVLANQDSLTGLPNRRSFFAYLDSLIGGGPVRTSFAVGVVDLDGFKPVNDIHGHGAGDKLLREVASRLLGALPGRGMLARLGGDEFAIILEQPGDDAKLLATCESMIATLRRPFALDEGSAAISATCGIARYMSASVTGDELYEMADFALYHSKQNNRGSVTLFSQEHEKEIRKVATISQRLRAADMERDFSICYQPIVDGLSGQTLGFEALARWSDRILGDVAPDVFIRSAEQNGTIGKITIGLLERALRTAACWPEGIYLSFNLSAHDLCSRETVDRILETMRRNAVTPGRLVFEITESAILQDFDRAIVAIGELRMAGASIALDDFGTGYSSLNYLRKLPIDRVKIDRSFVVDIEDDAPARDIMQAIIGLCRTMRLQCIVEGVETQTQLAELSAMGGMAYQGFLFGRPMSAEQLRAYLESVQEIRLAS
ncbi:MAG: putative bifunctional diguanylate cyclase/phosphodiesterase [Beijerinckiaceae bacterium]